MNSKTKNTILAGIIAALYIILTVLGNAIGIANGLRLSEALCILPCFSIAAVPGLFIGCFISNIVLGGTFLDIIFGSLATLIGAVGTYLLRKNRYIACIPPILANSIIVPWVLLKSAGSTKGYVLIAIFIFFGELVSCGLLGQLVYKLVKRISENN